MTRLEELKAVLDAKAAAEDAAYYVYDDARDAKAAAEADYYASGDAHYVAKAAYQAELKKQKEKQNDQ